RRPRSTRPVATVPTIRSARAPPPRSEPGVPLPAGEGCHRAQARRPLACGPRCDEDPCSAARLGGRAHASGPTLHSGRNSADTLVVRSVPGAGRGRRVVPGTEVPLTGPLSCLRSASTTRRIPSGRRRSSTPPTRAASTSSSSAVRQDRAHVLAIRWRAVLACAVLILAAAGPAVADDEALVDAPARWRSGHHAPPRGHDRHVRGSPRLPVRRLLDPAQPDRGGPRAGAEDRRGVPRARNPHRARIVQPVVPLPRYGTARVRSRRALVAAPRRAKGARSDRLACPPDP